MRELSSKRGGLQYQAPIILFSECVKHLTSRNASKASIFKTLAMSEESFKHPLCIICLLGGTNYAAWKDDCMQVLQGVMVGNVVMEEEEKPENRGSPNDFARNAVLACKAHKYYTHQKSQATAVISGSCSNPANALNTLRGGIGGQDAYHGRRNYQGVNRRNQGGNRHNNGGNIAHYGSLRRAHTDLSES